MRCNGLVAVALVAVAVITTTVGTDIDITQAAQGADKKSQGMTSSFDEIFEGVDALRRNAIKEARSLPADEAEILREKKGSKDFQNAFSSLDTMVSKMDHAAKQAKVEFPDLSIKDKTIPKAFTDEMDTSPKNEGRHMNKAVDVAKSLSKEIEKVESRKEIADSKVGTTATKVRNAEALDRTEAVGQIKNEHRNGEAKVGKVATKLADAGAKVGKVDTKLANTEADPGNSEITPSKEERLVLSKKAAKLLATMDKSTTSHSKLDSSNRTTHSAAAMMAKTSCVAMSAVMLCAAVMHW